MPLAGGSSAGRASRHQPPLPPDPQRGLKLGVVLAKLRTRLLGPLASLASDEQPHRSARNLSDVEAAFRHVDAALDHLCDSLRPKLAA